MSSLGSNETNLLEYVHERYAGWIRATVRRYLKHEVDDAIQQVMLRLATALPRNAERTEGALCALIGRTVRSTCIDALRARSRRPESEDLDSVPVPASGPSDPVELLDEVRSLKDRWTLLSDRERQILRLRLDDGLPFKAIAQILDVPQGSVAGWYSRAIERLREGVR